MAIRLRGPKALSSKIVAREVANLGLGAWTTTTQAACVMRAHHRRLRSDEVELERLVNRDLVSPGAPDLVLPIWKIFEQVDVPALFTSWVEHAMVNEKRQDVN